MPTYLYKAKNLKGESLEGSHESATQEALEYMLRERGYFLIDAKMEAEKFTLSGIFSKINIKDIAVFCRQFSVIINAGISVVEAISILTDQMEKKKFRAVLAGVSEELQKGKILSDAITMYPDVFPEFLRSMVKIGEASGSLDTILDRLADYYENENRIKRKIRVATTYPTILGLLTLVVVILLMVKVLPMFAGILAQMGGELPLITKGLMAASAFMTKNFVLMLMLMVLIIAALSYYFKSEAGRFWMDSMKLRLPIIKTTTSKVVTARFARSMGIMLKSGVPIINAIDIIAELIGNKVVEERLKESLESIKEGKSISISLKNMKIFPPLLTHMIAIGEKTGELDEMLSRTASFFDEEVEEAVDKMTTMLEPIMIIVLAVVVGTVLMAVMLPMMNIMSTVS